MTEHFSFAIMVSVCVMSVCIASVKGCQAVYNADSIRADTEQRIKLHQEFKGESHESKTN